MMMWSIFFILVNFFSSLSLPQVMEVSRSFGECARMNSPACRYRWRKRRGAPWKPSARSTVNWMMTLMATSISQNPMRWAVFFCLFVCLFVFFIEIWFRNDVVVKDNFVPFTCHLSHQLIVGFSHMIIMRNRLIWFVETVQLTCKVRFVYRLNWSIYWTRIDSHTSMMNKQMRLIQATWLKDTVSTCEPVGEAEVIELHNKRFQTTQ